jgi:hypothetical protein
MLRSCDLLQVKVPVLVFLLHKQQSGFICQTSYFPLLKLSYSNSECCGMNNIMYKQNNFTHN